MSSDVRVLNNSESEVDSITFDVHSAIAGLYPVSGFQCSLGIGYANGPFQSCGSRLDPSGVSTIENDTLEGGTPYMIQIRAVDTHGMLILSQLSFSGSPLENQLSPPPSSNNSTTPRNGNLNGVISNYGGDSISITGSANGGNGILNGIGGNGGHTGSATATAGNVIKGNDNRLEHWLDNNP